MYFHDLSPRGGRRKLAQAWLRRNVQASLFRLPDIPDKLGMHDVNFPSAKLYCRKSAIVPCTSANVGVKACWGKQAEACANGDN